MSYIGTFGSFTTARLGIYAAQKGLSVTGNNIANINTKGYTRQSLDQISLRLGGSDMYYSQSACRVGSGVLPIGVSQIRDPYLDIRYRNELSSVGAADAKLAGLDDLAAVLDEVADGSDENGIIEAQLSDLYKTLQNLSVNTNQQDADTQVRMSASALVTLFNSYAKRLEDLEQNAEKSLQQDVETVNRLLSNIRDLNATIRKSEIHGDSALEMRDERNRLIDELSQYMKLDVLYSTEDIGGGQMVEKLTLRLPGVKDGGKDVDLVDGIYTRQLDTPLTGPNYDISLSTLTDGRGNEPRGGSTVVDLSDTALYGALQATREILTEKGEFASQADIDRDAQATSKRGIPYYRKSLDLLANKIANEFNKANTGNLVGKDGQDTGIPHPDGGNLFSNSGDSDDATGITAANLSISKSWANGTVKIVNSFQQNAGSTDATNILHMIALMDTKKDYDPTDIDPGAASSAPMFKGTFQEMLCNIGTVLGNDRRATTIQLQTYQAAAVELDTSRESVAGVDLNDEAANLMQYQKSYAAACRLMTTLDEALEKLINGTGIVGR